MLSAVPNELLSSAPAISPLKPRSFYPRSFWGEGWGEGEARKRTAGQHALRGAERTLELGSCHISSKAAPLLPSSHDGGEGWGEGVR